MEALEKKLMRTKMCQNYLVTMGQHLVDYLLGCSATGDQSAVYGDTFGMYEISSDVNGDIHYAIWPNSGEGGTKEEVQSLYTKVVEIIENYPKYFGDLTPSIGDSVVKLTLNFKHMRAAEVTDKTFIDLLDTITTNVHISYDGCKSITQDKPDFNSELIL